MSEVKDEPKWSRFIKLCVVVIVVFVVFVVGGLVPYFSLSDWSGRGTFGDMFGAVNALFSGLAFAGVIYAILLQHEELQLQREELVLTRDELAKTAKAQELSAELMEKQVSLQVRSQQMEMRREIKSVEPIIKTGGGSSGGNPGKPGRKGSFELRNVGHSASDLTITFDSKILKLPVPEKSELDHNQTWRIDAEFLDSDEAKTIECVLSYQDVFGNEYSQPFTVNGLIATILSRKNLRRPVLDEVGNKGFANEAVRSDVDGTG